MVCEADVRHGCRRTVVVVSPTEFWRSRKHERLWTYCILSVSMLASTYTVSPQLCSLPLQYHFWRRIQNRARQVALVL